MKSWIEGCTYEEVFGMDADLKVNLEFCHGFEIPKTTSKEARQALKQLAKDGIICVYHDDGPAYLVARELHAIAGALGFDTYFPEHGSYRFVIVADEQRCKVKLN